MALIILCVSFAILLVLGVPVAFAIGLSSICTILYPAPCDFFERW